MRRISVSAMFAVATISAAAVYASAFPPAWSAPQAGSASAENAQPPDTKATSKTATAAATQTAPASSGNRWGRRYFPNLPVVTQDGKTGRFYDDFIKGRIVVISFIYTSCTDLCPLTTARMAQVQDKLGDIVGRKVFFISMSVDPAVDTPERLKAFADAFDAGPGWIFLTGKPEDINAINYRLGDRSQRQLSDHRNQIVLGNDATGEWARNSVFGELDQLVLTIREMDPDWRNTVHMARRSQVTNARIPLSKEPGQALFKKICSPCHSVGAGDRVGPDLRGVTARRDRDWLVSFIKNPRAKHAAKDPVTLDLEARFPGVRMPTLGLGDVDVSDLLTYLETETARLADSGRRGSPPDANRSLR